MHAWFAVRCKPRENERAEVNLLNQGYEVFRPLAQVLKRRGGKAVTVVESLFPGYLFIKLRPDRDTWYPVRSTRGVMDLVRFGNTSPSPVPDEVIAEIRSRQDIETGWVDLTSSSALRPNQAVRITAGPLMGHEALFQDLKGQDRVLVLLEIMKQSVLTTVPRSSIEEL